MTNTTPNIWLKKNQSKLRVAVIHYWFINWRGGEQVARSILNLFPQADVFTLFADPKTTKQHLPQYSIQTSSWNHPLFRRYYKQLFPLYPEITSSLKIPDVYDLVISSESGPAKAAFNGRAKHLCYVHSPMRYCYDFRQIYLDAIPLGLKTVANLFFERLKRWDYATQNQVDHFLANSKNVQQRVFKAYQRDAAVVYPGVADHWLQPLVATTHKDYFLSYGALTPYKGFDLLVEAFNQSGLPLIVVGNGSEKARLKAKAKNNIQFAQAASYQNLFGFLQGARALVFPAEEDFGFVPVEALSRGLPVIAYAKGGALETLHQNLDNPQQASAVFFDSPTPASLNQAVQIFTQLEKEFDPNYLQQQAKRFSQQNFNQGFVSQVQQLMGG